VETELGVTFVVMVTCVSANWVVIDDNTLRSIQALASTVEIACRHAIYDIAINKLRAFGAVRVVKLFLSAIFERKITCAKIPTSHIYVVGRN
jgi:hypothetical protein